MNLEMQQQKSPSHARVSPLSSLPRLARDQIQPACICGKFSGFSSLALENPDCCFLFAPPGLPKPLPPPTLPPMPWPSSGEEWGFARPAEQSVASIEHIKKRSRTPPAPCSPRRAHRNLGQSCPRGCMQAHEQELRAGIKSKQYLTPGGLVGALVAGSICARH